MTSTWILSGLIMVWMTPSGAGETAVDARAEVFGDRAYRFCHDPDFGKAGTLGADFCPIFDADTDSVCPEARRSCPTWGELDGFARRYRTWQRLGGLAFPGIPSELARFLLGVIVLASAVIALRALGRSGLRRPAQRRSAASVAEPETGPGRLPDAPAHRLLESAQSSLAAGHVNLAADQLHKALLRHFDDKGYIRWQPSGTNGDYARSLRSRPQLQALFRNAARQTERIRFGYGDVQPSEVKRLIEASGQALQADRSRKLPHAPMAILGILGLGLTPLGCELASRGAYRFHGPTGLSALPALLEASDMSVQVSRTRLSPTDMLDAGVVVLRSAALPDGLDASALLELLDKGIHVFILDDAWTVQEQFAIEAFFQAGSGVERIGRPPKHPVGLRTASLGSVFPAFDRELVLLPKARRLRPEPEPRFSPALETEVHAEAWLESEGGHAVAVRIEPPNESDGEMARGLLIVFADVDLFTNASLTRSGNAAAAIEVFSSLLGPGEVVHLLDEEEGYSAVESSEGADEASPPRPGEIVRASKLLPLLLQLGIFMLALFGMIGAAFGTLKDPKEVTRKSFAEHTDALGDLYARTGEPGRIFASRILARWLVHIQADRARAGDWETLCKELAETHGIPEADVRAAWSLGHGDPGSEALSPEQIHAISTLAAASHKRA